uniref:Pco105718 n=1 Tax=Arundo donax TaxID=35708 RepID=A0A0A9ALK8_ARUDO
MTDLLSFRMAACPAFDEWGSRLHMPLVFPCYFFVGSCPGSSRCHWLLSRIQQMSLTGIDYRSTSQAP